VLPAKRQRDAGECEPGTERVRLGRGVGPRVNVREADDADRRDEGKEHTEPEKDDDRPESDRLDHRTSPRSTVNFEIAIDIRKFNNA